MAKKVVLAGACRTAIGKMGGALSNTPAADLGAIVIKEALNRAGVKPEMVDEVKMGCVIQAAQGQNVARQASIKAGLPIEVPAITINVVCGSGLKCVNDAATMIMAVTDGIHFPSPGSVKLHYRAQKTRKIPGISGRYPFPLRVFKTPCEF